MLYYIIPFVIIVASIIMLVLTVYKKLPQITSMNVETIPQEKERRVRNRIMAERLLRQYRDAKQVATTVATPVLKNAATGWNVLYQKALEWEKRSLEKLQPLKNIDVKQEISDRLAQLDQMMIDKDWEEAEEIAISVIELDPKNITSYRALAEIYLERKEYKKSRETYRYMLKLMTYGRGKINVNVDKHVLANTYIGLGWVYQLEGRNSYAQANYKKAVELEGNNPRFLDLLLKISIILKDKALALQVFNSLQASDPSNQKLPEIKAEIDALPEATPRTARGVKIEEEDSEIG